jgi:hypothetical protein
MKFGFLVVCSAIALRPVVTSATSVRMGDRPATTCAALGSVPDYIRGLSCRMARMIASGTGRSATFRHLVEHVGRLNGIVYIEEDYYLNTHTRTRLMGALVHRVTVSGDSRILHLFIAPVSGDQPVITMAHELQHVVEVLESGAVTEDEINQLFDRIGNRIRAGIVETHAALDVENVVRRELSKRTDAISSLPVADEDNVSGSFRTHPIVRTTVLARTAANLTTP